MNSRVGFALGDNEFASPEQQFTLKEQNALFSESANFKRHVFGGEFLPLSSYTVAGRFCSSSPLFLKQNYSFLSFGRKTKLKSAPPRNPLGPRVHSELHSKLAEIGAKIYRHSSRFTQRRILSL